MISFNINAYKLAILFTYIIFLYLVLPAFSCYAMIATFGANIELRCCNTNLVKTSTRKSCISHPYLGIPTLSYFSKGSLPLSVSCRDVESTSSKGSTIVAALRSNNHGGSANMGSDGLTYKDAGVDIDAGSELVKRIAKMAPGIGGFGGLFPFGAVFLTCLWLLLLFPFTWFIHVVLGLYELFLCLLFHLEKKAIYFFRSFFVSYFLLV